MIKGERAMIGAGSARNSRGFTLVELLVVISIIALLISILLPSLRSAREQAKLVVCKANIRSLAQATNVYLADGEGRTPAGHYNNAGGNSPKANVGRQIGDLIPPDDIQVWDSIGGLLEKYVLADPMEIYRCPSAKNSPDDNFSITGTNPFSGQAIDDEFKPNYFYMCTAQWIVLPDNTSWYPQVWATRNVANIPETQIRTPSDTVTWVDESTSHHTNSTDIYNRNASGRLNVKDFSNFGYLDGHAETKRFENLAGYFKSLSPPLPQSQWGIDFLTHSHWTIANDFP